MTRIIQQMLIALAFHTLCSKVDQLIFGAASEGENPHSRQVMSILISVFLIVALFFLLGYALYQIAELFGF